LGHPDGLGGGRSAAGGTARSCLASAESFTLWCSDFQVATSQFRRVRSRWRGDVGDQCCRPVLQLRGCHRELRRSNSYRHAQAAGNHSCRRLFDGSDPPAVLRSLAARHSEIVRVHAMPRNGGPARARNAGAAIAKGEFLFFLDRDTEVLPAALANFSTRIAECDSDCPERSSSDSRAWQTCSTLCRVMSPICSAMTAAAIRALIWQASSAIVVMDLTASLRDRVPGIGVTALSPFDLRRAWPD